MLGLLDRASSYRVNYTQTNSEPVSKLVFQFQFSQKMNANCITALNYDCKFVNATLYSLTNHIQTS
jgi:hypothetical protein